MKGEIIMEYDQIVNFNGEIGKVVTDEGKFYFLPVRYGSYSCSNLEEITDEVVAPASFEEKIQYIRQNFSWGDVIQVHIIGEYQIIEHMDTDGVIRFHPYINFRDYHNTYSSLDIALIGIITGNSLEVNEARYATTCILRILKKQE